MAYRSYTLLILTLLQLSQAELPPESWYSANVIPEGFQPKPITEIFTTYPPFSTTNPIVVGPVSTEKPDDFGLLSSLAQQKTTDLFPSTNKVTLPSTQTTASPFVTQTLSTLSQTASPISTVSPESFSTLSTPSPRPEITVQSESPQPVFTQSTVPPTLSTQSPLFFNEEDLRLTTLSTPPPNTQQAIWPQVDTLQPQTVPRPSDISQTSGPGSIPNYIVIYQQAPQYVQGDGNTQEQPNVTTSPSTLATSTPSTVLITQPTTVSIEPRPTIFTSARTTPSTSTTTRVPRTVSTHRPVLCRNSTFQASGPVYPYPLNIRVVAPPGSITNLKFNRITTTTKAPTTTRSRKPKRNTYESCLHGCKPNREPICAIPLASTQIDTSTLKGFPSVCHMACHNSYRKEAYQQLIEGRCSRLHTRIKPLDSSTKLKKDDLTKTQYSVDNSQPPTIVEFTGTLH